MVSELEFADIEDIAEIRYNRFRNIDPFPDIAPSLLNTADISDYVRKTGMIFPFNPDKLKSASYEMGLGGEVLYWDENDNEKNSCLCTGGEVVLRRNSITFVTVDAKFRLPDYIAMRFNLQIEHVHKGILLGTGPLINPGFCGRLMIPMHNLTCNDYTLKAGEELIGVEFTKLSHNSSWNNPVIDKIARIGKYKRNLGKKNDKVFRDFIDKNVPRGKIVKSSLSGTIDKANQSAMKAEELIDKIKKYSMIGAVLGMIALFTLIYQVYDIVSSANSYVANSKDKLYELQATNQELKKQIDARMTVLETKLKIAPKK